MKKTIAFVFLICCTAFGQTQQQTKNPKFVVLANVGQSFRLAETPDGLSAADREYVKELKTGLSYDFSAYYVKNESGYGLKYNVFRSKNDRISPISLDPIVSGLTSVSDDITISYIGPTFIYTEGQNAKVGEAFFEVSLGYMAYKNRATFEYERFTIKGGTFGMIAGGGYHFRVHKQFLIGPQVSFVGGTIKKFKLQRSNGTTETIKLEKDNYENLWRIDLSISAKFRF